MEGVFSLNVNSEFLIKLTTYSLERIVGTIVYTTLIFQKKKLNLYFFILHC